MTTPLSLTNAARTGTVWPNQRVIVDTTQHFMYQGDGSTLGGIPLNASTGVQVFNVMNYGAAGNYKQVSNASATTSSAVLTSTGAGFTAADVGKTFSLQGAGATSTVPGVSGAMLYGTIIGYNSSTSVTLSVTPSTAVTNAIFSYFSDDTVAIQAAISAAQIAATGHSNNSVGSAAVYFPSAVYGIGSYNAGSGGSFYYSLLLGNSAQQNNIVFIGDNAEIVTSLYQDNISIISSLFNVTNYVNNLGFTGLRLRNGHQNTYAITAGITVTGTVANTIAYLAIKDCIFEDFAQSIRCIGAVAPTIRNNRFLSNRGRCSGALVPTPGSGLPTAPNVSIWLFCNHNGNVLNATIEGNYFDGAVNNYDVSQNPTYTQKALDGMIYGTSLGWNISGNTIVRHGVEAIFVFARFATNSIQTITLANATSGTFTLSIPGNSGSPTVPIAWNAAASDVQSALATLVGVGNVSVTLSGSVFTVTFNGSLAGNAQPTMTANASSLPGGTVTIAVTGYGYNPNAGTDYPCTVVGNTIDSTPTTGSAGASPYSIRCDESGAVVNSNSITGSIRGIIENGSDAISYPAGLRVKNVTIAGNRIGMLSNSISYFGISVSNLDNGKIANNAITWQGGYVMDLANGVTSIPGISTYSCSNIHISNNDVLCTPQTVTVTATLAQLSTSAGATIIPSISGTAITVLDYSIAVSGTFTEAPGLLLESDSVTPLPVAFIPESLLKTTTVNLTPTSINTVLATSYNRQTGSAGTPQGTFGSPSGVSAGIRLRTASFPYMVQTITIGGTVTGGYFTLTYGGLTTAQMPYSSSAIPTAAVVQSALQSLANITQGNVTVTLTGSVYTVSFVNILAMQAQTLLTATNSFTGTSPTITIAPVVVQAITIGGTPTGGFFTLSFYSPTYPSIPTQTTGQLNYSAGLPSAATVQSALAALSNIGAGNVTVTLNGSVYTVMFTDLLANVMTYTNSLTGGTIAISPDLTANLTITASYKQNIATAPVVQTVTIGGTLTGGSFTLSFYSGTYPSIPTQTTGNLTYSGSTPPSAATVQAALAALSNVGTGNVTVTLNGSVYTIVFTDLLAVVMTYTNSLTGTSPTITIGFVGPTYEVLNGLSIASGTGYLIDGNYIEGADSSAAFVSNPSGEIINHRTKYCGTQFSGALNNMLARQQVITFIPQSGVPGSQFYTLINGASNGLDNIYGEITLNALMDNQRSATKFNFTYIGYGNGGFLNQSLQSIGSRFSYAQGRTDSPSGNSSNTFIDLGTTNIISPAPVTVTLDTVQTGLFLKDPPPFGVNTNAFVAPINFSYGYASSGAFTASNTQITYTGNGTYQALYGQAEYGMDASGGNITLQLRNANNYASGQIVQVTRTDSNGNNTATIACVSGQTINPGGYGNLALSVGESIRIRSSGTTQFYIESDYKTGLVQEIQVVVLRTVLNAGAVVLIPGQIGKAITVLDFTAVVSGNYVGGTGVTLASTNVTPVIVAAIPVALLTDTAVIFASSSTVTYGAGFSAAMGVGDGLQLVNSSTNPSAGTSITFTITYKQA